MSTFPTVSGAQRIRALRKLGEEELKETIQQGRRRQIPIQPQKYEYSKAYGHLVDHNTHIVALVLFRMRENEQGRPMTNNYLVTAFQKEIK